MKNLSTPKNTLAVLFGGIFLLFTQSLSAQDTLYWEDFEGVSSSFTLNTTDLGGTTSGYNDWAINNAYTGGSGTLICIGFPITFTVNNTPAQPAGISSPNGNYLHMVADAAVASNIFNANYQPADGTCGAAENYFSRMTGDISTLGRTNTTLNFWWLGANSNSSYGEVYYSTNSGTSWNQITAPISQYFNQVSWTQQSVSLPAFDNQSTLRFGFRFVNNI